MSCDLDYLCLVWPRGTAALFFLAPDFAVGRGAGVHTGRETGRLAPRRPALVSARARRSGRRVRWAKTNHVEIEEQAVVGVLRESPGSSRRRGRA